MSNDRVLVHPVKIIKSDHILYFKTEEQARIFCMSYCGCYVMHEQYLKRGSFVFEVFEI